MSKPRKFRPSFDALEDRVTPAANVGFQSGVLVVSPPSNGHAAQQSISLPDSSSLQAGKGLAIAASQPNNPTVSFEVP